MNNSIYQINKGINKSIEFHGLRAQYIWYFGGLAMALLLLYAAFYICGAGTLISLSVTGASATYGTLKIFRLSRTYGEHGLMKAAAKRRLPKAIRSNSRRFFQQLNLKENSYE